jgi:hypothetical protein
VPAGDNSTPVAGGDTYATDELNTVNGVAQTAPLPKAQRMKVGYGDDGDYRDASQAFPMPVNLASSEGNVPRAAGPLTASAATASGAASTASTVVCDVVPAGNVTVELTTVATTGAFVGTVAFEASVDPVGAATRWDAVPVLAMNPANPSTNGQPMALNLGAGVCRTYRAPMLGQALFRVRCTAFTSGSLTVTIIPGPGWIENMPMVQVVPPTTFSVTRVTTSGTANTTTTLAPADSNRKGCLIWNDHASAIVTVSLGVTAVSTSNIFSLDVAPGGYLEVPRDFVTAAITCFSATVSVPVNLTLAA